MKNKFKWKYQPKGKVSAQVAGEAIEQIAKRHAGQVKPKMLVEAAKAKKHPLHKCFEWDDSIAGEKYREQQARNIIVQITIVEEIQGNKEPLRVRAFVSVEEDSDVHYTTMARAMTDEQLRRQVVSQAISDLNAIKEKYKDLQELSSVFAAIASAERRFKQKKHRKAS
jgi:hypothetical protein